MAICCNLCRTLCASCFSTLLMGHKIKGYDVELIGPIGSLIKYKDDRAEQLFVLKANGVEQDVQVRCSRQEPLAPLQISTAEI